ncbi:isoprenylcysteine carboxylmethyltransferase family protein [Roseovarius aestuarii]|nr:isoprenylcysteine carboxylmethyltransferase family protein [Roseovarius aestuarii]
MKKWIDVPPLWLLGALVLAWAQARWWSMGLNFGGGAADFLGGVLIGGGVLLIILAAWEMRRMRTTVIPNREADKLVTSGIFKRSRNPIYVGDALILAGCILRWDAVLALVLLPCFVWIIEKRFVIPEENMLRRKFRADFARYMQKTRRWV